MLTAFRFTSSMTNLIGILKVEEWKSRKLILLYYLLIYKNDLRDFKNCARLILQVDIFKGQEDWFYYIIY